MTPTNLWFPARIFQNFSKHHVSNYTTKSTLFFKQERRQQQAHITREITGNLLKRQLDKFTPSKSTTLNYHTFLHVIFKVLPFDREGKIAHINSIFLPAAAFFRPFSVRFGSRVRGISVRLFPFPLKATSFTNSFAVIVSITFPASFPIVSRVTENCFFVFKLSSHFHKLLYAFCNHLLLLLPKLVAFAHAFRRYTFSRVFKLTVNTCFHLSNWHVVILSFIFLFSALELVGFFRVGVRLKAISIVRMSFFYQRKG